MNKDHCLQTDKEGALHLWAMTSAAQPEPLRLMATAVNFVSVFTHLALPSTCLERPCPPGTENLELVHPLPPSQGEASLKSP